MEETSEYLKNKLEDGCTKSKLYGEVKINGKSINRLLSSSRVKEALLENIAEPVSEGDYSLDNYTCTIYSKDVFSNPNGVKDLRTLGVSEEDIETSVYDFYGGLEVTISYDIQFKGVGNIKDKDKIIEAYEDYINNPFSDGYTANALMSRFRLPMKAMKKLYDESKEERLSNINTGERAYEAITGVLAQYKEQKQFLVGAEFPLTELENILNSYKKNLK